MKITTEQVRLYVFVIATGIVNAMTLIMLLARMRIAQDSGMVMGVGFVNLFFLVLDFLS